MNIDFCSMSLFLGFKFDLFIYNDFFFFTRDMTFRLRNSPLRSRMLGLLNVFSGMVGGLWGTSEDLLSLSAQGEEGTS